MPASSNVKALPSCEGPPQAVQAVQAVQAAASSRVVSRRIIG